MSQRIGWRLGEFGGIEGGAGGTGIGTLQQGTLKYLIILVKNEFI
jgi:hypothetical protein